MSSSGVVTPEWLTAVLHRNGVARQSSVRTVKVILRKELPISTVCRLGLTYTEEVDASYPRTVFLKIPRVSNEGTRVPHADDNAEIEFYRHVAPAIGCPPLIKCYDAAEAAGRSHLLLDDLSDTHSQPEPEHAPSFEMSRLAVEALAKAHASWWSIDTTSSKTIPLSASLLNKFDDSAIRKFVEDLNRSVQDFLAAMELTEKQKDAYRRMLTSADVIWGRLTRRDHLTVTHGDTHWWNFLYPNDPRTHAVHILDWQLWHIDLGARDLAFLLALGGFAEPRPSVEDELLRAYHNALGVPEYSWEMLIEDYRWSAIRNLNIPVIFRAQGKHESTVRTALRRGFEAYERLECGSLI